MTRAKSVLSARLVGRGSDPRRHRNGASRASTPATGIRRTKGSFPIWVGAQRRSSTCRTPASPAATATTSRSAAPCAGFDILSAQVNFYDIDDPGTIVESFNLKTNAIVTGINIAGGKLSRNRHRLLRLLHTDDAHRRRRHLFVQPAPVRRQPGAADLCQSDDDVARLRLRCRSPAPSAGISANPAIGTFTTAVPEPETYLLMLAGLSAVGFAARRRRR